MPSATQPTITDLLPRTIEWRDGTLYLLDQTRLPWDVVTERQENAGDVWRAIKQLKVRGAPAIGVAAAYGLCVAVRPFLSGPADTFREEIDRQAAYLTSARPTAVNLGWALRRMQRAVATAAGDASRIYDRLVAEAAAIHAEDQAMCLGIGEAGLPLIEEGAGILTHCNAGALCSSGIGTATAPLYLAKDRGVAFHVFADETRPLLQGARLTAWELMQGGIDVTLITDSMAAAMMQAGAISLVITGADRVAANGDVANKIGTLGVAILADHFGIPFYVAVPSSTIDMECESGDAIPIEERDADEVTRFGDLRTAPSDVAVRNPAFDVTPHDLVAGLVTERGIISPPYGEHLLKLFVNGVNA
jgi:methylthioribose-1-phosphate isomerase